MIEVELKARVFNISETRRKAAKIGRYIGKEKKVDEYYTLENLEHYPKKSLRIRKRSGYYEINFKKDKSYEEGVHAKKETEFKVSDINGFKELIEDFGFKKWVVKEKETELYRIKNDLHIELNYVKSLGWFIEVEYLCNNRNEIVKCREKVVRIFRELGISQKDIVKEGYTRLLWNKRR